MEYYTSPRGGLVPSLAMIAVVFPGQGSQKPGMGKELAGAFAVARETYEMVSEATGIDVAQLSWQEDEELLRQTQNAQIALFTASLAAYRVFASESQIPISAFAGHSVGEFTALVASEIYAPEIGARLVKARGLTMAAAGAENPGAMAAVLGLDTEILTAFVVILPASSRSRTITLQGR